MLGHLEIGDYLLQERIYNNRPVYKHEIREFYLYYYTGSSCSYWTVGSTVGVEGRFYNPGNDVFPNRLTDSWKILDENTLRWNDTQVVINCI